MDWTTIIVTLISVLLTGGLISSVFFYNENKRKAKAEVSKANAEAKKEYASANMVDAEASNGLINVLNGMSGYMKEMMKYNQEVNLKLLEDIKNKDANIEEFKKEIASLKLKVAENDRKLVGLQKAFDNEVSLRLEAEKNKCVVENCKLRQPPKKQTA